MQLFALLGSARVKAAQKHVGEIDPYVGRRQTTQSKRRQLTNRRSSAESVAEIVLQQRLGNWSEKNTW